MTDIIGDEDGFWDDDNLKVVDEKRVQGIKIISKFPENANTDLNISREPISPYFQNDSQDNMNYNYEDQNGYKQFNPMMSTNQEQHNQMVKYNVQAYNQSFNNNNNMNQFHQSYSYNQPAYSGINMNLLGGSTYKRNY